MVNAAASCIVREPFSEQKVRDAAHRLLQDIGGRVTCAFVFVSPDYAEHLEDFLELIQLHGHVPELIGCTGWGIIGRATEAERESGFSLLFLHLPHTKVTAVSISYADSEYLSSPSDWHRATRVGAKEVDAWLAVVDPVGDSLEHWLEGLNKAWPGIPCLGGLASSSSAVGETIIFHNRRRLESGFAAFALQGGVRLLPIVSQGCKPIGEPLPITKAEDNAVFELGTRKAFGTLTEVYHSLPESDRLRAHGNLFAGLAMSEYVDEYKRGDFLIRNILGANPENGAVVINAIPRVGQTLQYQLRDAQTADEDLRLAVQEAKHTGIHPFAALLFSCNGRGRGLFGLPHHDAGILNESFECVPCAGFFCNGEIGPVGGINFIHSYTASIALLADA